MTEKKQSFWDRLALSIAPTWGMNRLKSRIIADALTSTSKRGYEIAQPGRRTSGWQRSASDADVQIRAALLEARMHSRELIRNNSWARRAQRVIANNAVGWGIVPKATGVPDDVAKKALAIWNKWAGTTECESEGRHTFYGIQHLAMKTIVESGEVLLRRRPRQVKDSLSIPLQIQVLEPDFLDHAKTFFGEEGKGPTIMGVEFDLIGRRTAYWLFDTHPGSGRNVQASHRVPASEVAHVYYTERPGQSRGISWLVTAIITLKDFDEYEDATLMRQKIAAAFAGFVVDLDGSGPGIGDPDSTDTELETFGPGEIQYLPPGKTVTFNNPPQTADDSFSNRNLRRVAAGLSIPFEDLTGDYSQVNYSSARMSRIAHWASVRDWQFNMLIPLLCQVVWGWAMDAAVGAGELTIAPTADWTTPPIPMIEPDKEGLAYQRLVRNGTMTFSEMVREQGGDPKAHFEAYAADLKMLDDLKIKLDSDVRAVSQAGLTQERPGVGGGKPPADPKE